MKKKGSIKTGGRKSGTPNKISREERDFLRELLASTQEKANATFNELYQTDPRAFLAEREKLIKYVCPALQAVAISDISPHGGSQLTAMSVLATILGVSPEPSEPSTHFISNFEV